MGTEKTGAICTSQELLQRVTQQPVDQSDLSKLRSFGKIGSRHVLSIFGGALTGLHGGKAHHFLTGAVTYWQRFWKLCFCF